MRAIVLLAFAVAACGPPPERRGPEDTLAAYERAVAGRRLDQAWALLSSEYRKTHDRAAFERELATRSPPRPGLGAARARLTAEVALPDGERLPLVWEDGAWRLGRDPLDFYPQTTPAEALRSFARAVEARRWDVLARFVPARYRASVTADKMRERWEGERRAELLGSLARVRDELARPTVQLEVSPGGDHAELPLAPLPGSGEHKQARLVREEGLWRVEALE